MENEVMEHDYEKELGWDDEIEKESEFTVLKAGDYDFEITSFVRSRSKGSEKMPASNMAVLTLKVGNSKESTVIIDYLVLHSKMEWKLSQFFCSIGQKKHGEPLKMNWSKVTGAKGRCKVIVEKYTNDKGEERESNKIDKYYDYIPNQSEPTAQKKFTAGDF